MNKSYYLPALITGFLMFAGGCGTGPKVELVQGKNCIDVMIGTKHFTSYLYGDELPRPVLFPLRSPSGIAVGRSYPLAEVEGETKDHPHHTGLFFAYRYVNDDDFWLSTASPARIRHMKVTKMTGTTCRGDLSTVSRWVGKDGQVLLEENRDMLFLAGKDEYTIDFNITLAAQDTKVVFTDSKEGMLAVHVADWLKESGGSGTYFSSSGDRTEKEVWGKRARWVCLQGQKDGRTIGIAILNHPSSVNYPTYWHTRGYGLFAANPLGQYVFEKERDPQQARPFQLTLEPGQTAHFRFRVIIYEGDRTGQQIEQRFRKFAE